jgi:aromatic ring hydroxylase
LKRLHDETKRIDLFFQDAKVNPKIDRKMLVETMYHKRIVAEILTDRVFGRIQKEREMWATIEVAVDNQLK